jgi:hypothetical protein
MTLVYVTKFIMHNNIKVVLYLYQFIRLTRCLRQKFDHNSLLINRYGVSIIDCCINYLIELFYFKKCDVMVS